MDYKPFYISLTLIFLVGVLMPLIISPFVDIDNPPEALLITPIVNVINNGVTIFDGISIFGFNLGWSFNPFNILGETIQTGLINYLNIFAFIPSILLLPMIIIILFGFIYTAIKLLPLT